MHFLTIYLLYVCDEHRAWHRRSQRWWGRPTPGPPRASKIARRHLKMLEIYKLIYIALLIKHNISLVFRSPVQTFWILSWLIYFCGIWVDLLISFSGDMYFCYDITVGLIFQNLEILSYYITYCSVSTQYSSSSNKYRNPNVLFSWVRNCEHGAQHLDCIWHIPLVICLSDVFSAKFQNLVTIKCN